MCCDKVQANAGTLVCKAVAAMSVSAPGFCVCGIFMQQVTTLNAFDIAGTRHQARVFPIHCSKAEQDHALHAH